MTQDDEADEVLPALAAAAQIPGDFLGQVADPDEHELRERHVRPQNDEGQQQTAEIAQVRRSQGAGKWRSIGQEEQHGQGEGEAIEQLGNGEHYRVNR